MKQLLIVISVLLIVPFSAHAGGIEVSPAKLDIKIDSGTFAAQITVANPTADVQIFEIYADDLGELFEFSPASFTLESGARKTVEVTVSSPKNKLSDSTLLSTQISVLAKPLAESRLQAATGVKIPVSITVDQSSHKKTSPYFLIGAGLIVIVVLIWQLFHRRQRSTAV